MVVECLNQASGEGWSWFHGDCIELIKSIPDESIHYQLFSIPFSALFTYSNSERDLGNCKNDAEFFHHYGYLVEELYRVLKPGRCVSIHCANIPAMKSRDGYIGLKDFRGGCIRAMCGNEAGDFYTAITRMETRLKIAKIEEDWRRFERLANTIESMRAELSEFPARKGEWIYHSEVLIWKNPVTEMQRTHSIGLLHNQMVKDSCMSRQGIPDHVVTFRKPGVNPEPVSGKLTHFSGTGYDYPLRRFEEYQVKMESWAVYQSLKTDKERWEHADCGGVTEEPNINTIMDDYKLSVETWERYASPVWMDIVQSDTLQHRAARDDKDSRHIAPLQLGVIHRCLQLWTNPGDIVLSPFGGIASEGYESVKMGRKFIGFELKDSYWRQGVENLRRAEQEAKVPELPLVFEDSP